MDFKDLARFQDWMSDEWRIPGSSAVGYVGGREVYRHSSGYADIEERRPMTGDELMFMYSITKTITSLCGLQLLEKGLFHLNDGLDYYMPEFRDVNVKHRLPDGTEEIRPAENYIRVRDVFTMTSGYDYTTETEAVNALKDGDGNISTADMAKGLARSPLCFEPGEKWCYGMSHDILGAFIERLTGERFADYVQKNVFDPVGMKNSYFHLPKEEFESKAATQYSFSDVKCAAEKIPLTNFSVFGDEYDSGGAGLISTVPDVALYAATLARGGVTLSGERIITKASIDLWRTNCLNEAQMRSYDWDTLSGYGYGLGVRTHIDKAKSGSLSPLGEFGWTGAAGGFMMVDPDNDVAFYYAHHMLNNQEYFTNPRLRNLFYACLEK
ncbi:MAG: beta-lactamase family protein [Clostridia bacterium]|nr:beta-lactamase family protein [Clostridia bacterium]